MNPVPNAYTFGDTKVFITITSGLVDMMDDEELDAVIAHECGHIMCRHVLYHSVATEIFNGAGKLGILGDLAKPIMWAMYHWWRMSELSCDRCASIVTSPDVVARTMARLAGGPKDITSDLNMDEWARQADKYEEIRSNNIWDKALQLSVVLELDHPFNAVRVREILEWGKSPQYRNISTNIKILESNKKCPKWGRGVCDDWAYCKYCGIRL